MYDMTDSQRAFIDAMKTAGHSPKPDRYFTIGGVDWFVMDWDYCNGPGCSVCNDSWCYHCWERDGRKPLEPCECIEDNVVSATTRDCTK